MTTPNLKQLIDKYRDLETSDDAKKLQIEVWLSAFKKVTNETMYGFECYLSLLIGRGPDERVRYFKNIKNGYKPSREHFQRGKLDIIHELHKHYGHHEIKFWFYSPFWYVISDKFALLGLTPEVLRAVLAETMAITRANAAFMGHKGNEIDEFLVFDEPLRFGRKKQAKKTIKIPQVLQGPATFDQLAILAVLYREAYIGCAIGYAAQIRTLFLEKFNELLDHPCLDESLKPRLFKLTIERVLIPIRQNRRNKARNMESSYLSVSKPMDRPDDLISFLRSHDKTVKRP